ncbi:DUF3052 domain-containing protein [Streptomyces sp. NBC_00090]|uniref:DUF3052 domain-containing protein n=1 Tax=Streptomyces sp. NBC_00090 TaxID=2903619 RepID=UPI00324AC276
MSDAATTATAATRLGIESGDVILDVGWDDDCDDAVRESVEAAAGRAVLDTEPEEPVDVVLFWFRAGDGDLDDMIAEAAEPLRDGGVLWILTPGPGRPGHVDPADVAESATVAGLAQVSTVSVGAWNAGRLVAPKSRD